MPMDPALRRQTLLSNIIGNVGLWGTNQAPNSVAEALARGRAADQSVKSAMVQDEALAARMKRKDAQEAREQATIEQQQIATQEAAVRRNKAKQIMSQLRDKKITREDATAAWSQLGPEGQAAMQEFQSAADFIKAGQPAPAKAPEIWTQQATVGGQPYIQTWGMKNGQPTLLGQAAKGSGVSVNIGDRGPKLPAQHMWRDPNDPTQGVMPIPGSPAEQEALAARQEQQAGKEVVATAAQTVYEDIDRAQEVMDKYGQATAGLAGKGTAWLPTTPAHQVQTHIDSIKGNIGIDSLLKIKKSGAGLGHIPQAQLDMLASLMGKLDTSMRYEDLKYNLARIKGIYGDIVEKSGGDPKAQYEERKAELGDTPTTTTSGWSFELVD